MAQPERRASESGKWTAIEEHMTAQTLHMEYVRKDIGAVKKSLDGTDVRQLRDKVGEHSTFINRLKGGGVVVVGGWAAIKLYLSNLLGGY